MHYRKISLFQSLNQLLYCRIHYSIIVISKLHANLRHRFPQLTPSFLLSTPCFSETARHLLKYTAINMSSDQDDPVKEQNKVKAKASGDLDKVTDYVEEREMDSSKVADSMRAVLGSASAAKKSTEEQELMHVKIQQADLQLIVDELDMHPKKAERALRRAGGDVIKALCELVR